MSQSTPSRAHEGRTAGGAVEGRLLAIGDIHGCHIALERLLDGLQVTPRDTVVQVGDAIDRGPGTKQVIDRLIALAGYCRLVFLLGNHEESFLSSIWKRQAFLDWLQFGGREALDSYGRGTATLPEDHARFIRSGVDYFENDSFVFVHANLEPGVPLEHQVPEWLRWKKLTKEEQPLPGGRRVICGHTPQKDGRPWIGDGWLCIDTYAYGGLFLTAVDLTNDLVYQASQAGQSRGPARLAECRTAWEPDWAP